jgi:hypothetical protein
MRRTTRLVFIGILIIAFIYIAHTMVNPPTVKPNKEGFAVTYAKDCNCSPGYTAQLCGDPVNSTYEQMGGKCEAGTYFCQKSITPYTRIKCSS